MLSLLRLERKQKKYSNPSRIGIFLFLSYSFGIETINMFIYSVVPSKTIADSRPKWAKCISVFRPKRRENPTRWGGTDLYGLHKGVPPPPPRADSEWWEDCFLLQLVDWILISLLQISRDIPACSKSVLKIYSTFVLQQLGSVSNCRNHKFWKAVISNKHACVVKNGRRYHTQTRK